MVVAIPMYIDYLGSKEGVPYPKREDISLLDFGQSGYFGQVITAHRHAKKLDILAFLKSSDLYIYAKCQKSRGCYCKREEILVSNLQPSGYFRRSLQDVGVQKC